MAFTEFVVKTLFYALKRYTIGNFSQPKNENSSAEKEG
jgi:hypothetical protein